MNKYEALLSKTKDSNWEIFYQGIIPLNFDNIIRGENFIRIRHASTNSDLTADIQYLKNSKYPECYLRKYLGEYR